MCKKFYQAYNLLASADCRIAMDDVLTSSPSACPPFSQAMIAPVRTMISCRKAEYQRRAKDVAAMYALFWERMHIKSIDMDLISTQA